MEIIIKDIEIQNFRLFSNLKVSFEKDLTVLIGINGAGKTTILDAVAGLIKYIAEVITYKKHEPEFYQKQDIRNGTENFENTLNFQGKLAGLTVNFTEFNRLSAFNFTDSDSDNLTESYFEQLHNEALSKPTNLPVMVYYPSGFATLPFPGNHDMDISNDIFNIYENAFGRDTFDYPFFKKWLVWQYNLKNETGKTNYFDTVASAILSVLNDAENANYNTVKISYKNLPKGEIVLHKKGEELTENQLSSGEKNLLMLTADLARRLCIANQHLTNPLQGQGIVLIDEIDLHLHPRWQRKVIPQLRKTFPNIQFVVTTHSPLVLENIEPRNIRLLKDNEVIVPDFYPKGREIGEILEELMDENALAIQNEIDNYFALIAENKFDEAEQYKQNTLLKLTTEENPIFYQANAMIKRKKIIANEAHKKK